MRMRFGKFTGVEVGDLPDDYLGWLRGLDDLREPLRSAVQAEWRARFEPVLPPHSGLSCDARAMAQELVAAGYRVLAKLHHPDHGGETRTMQLLNEAVAWHRAQARSC